MEDHGSSQDLSPSAGVKHTPGPWFVFADSGHAVAVLPAMRSGEICSFEGSGKPERDANARLIAAAPDLLSSLRQAVLEIEEAAKCWRPTMPALATVYDHAAQRHRAAIAKASGESPQ